MKNQYYFALSMTYAEFLPYYQGHIEWVQVKTSLGLTIRFPAFHLRRFISAGGISGYFLLITENNKFISLEKIR